MSDFLAALDAITTTQEPSTSVEPAFPALSPDWETPSAVKLVSPAELLAPIGDRGVKLEQLIDLSLHKAEELLRLPVDQLDENYIKVASMQKDLVVSLVNTGLKVDENRFKRQSTAALAAILGQITAAEDRLESAQAPRQIPPA